MVSRLVKTYFLNSFDLQKFSKIFFHHSTVPFRKLSEELFIECDPSDFNLIKTKISTFNKHRTVTTREVITSNFGDYFIKFVSQLIKAADVEMMLTYVFIRLQSIVPYFL